MGVATDALQGMTYAAEQGVNFASTLTIGRQTLYAEDNSIEKMLKRRGARLDMLCPPDERGRRWAEGLFEHFGAERVDSLDYSDYEHATIVHDMNTPVADELKNRYSLVWDGGTLEHVFNYPTALRNCMEMVAPCGHLVLHTPANNFFGHGFYQFSPELFFSLLVEQNGFADTQVLIQDDCLRWYAVASPCEIGRRVDICRARRTPSLILVISRKVGEVPTTLTVQQSDYVVQWEASGSGAGEATSPLRRLYCTVVPVPLQRAIERCVFAVRRPCRRRKLLKLFYKRVRIS
ncbi:MAG: hypothetical protein LBH06_03425 [Rikenellaceae bacterium]|jgi:hypothetical protein|nr:hypothetical protein [Rikenellaceae bacterium]